MKMKKVLFSATIACTIFATMPSYGQLALVNKADSELMKNNVEEARKLIEEAIKDPKAAEKAKSWLVKGKVYTELALSPNTDAQLLPAYIKTANECFEKTLQLEKTGAFATAAIQKNQAIQDHFETNGKKAFDGKDYSSAGNYFFLTSLATQNEADRLAMLNNAFIAYANTDEHSKTKQIGEDLIKSGRKDENLIRGLIKVAREESGHNHGAFLEQMRKYSEYVKNDPIVLAMEINALVDMSAQEKKNGNDDEAIDIIKEAIELIDEMYKIDAKNVSLYITQAHLYEDIADHANAMKTIKKAQEVFPDNENLVFELGVMNYNNGIGIYKKYVAMSLAEQRSEQGKQAKLDYEKYFNDALPYLEKYFANSTKATKEQYDALYNVYSLLKMQDKADAIKNKTSIFSDED